MLCIGFYVMGVVTGVMGTVAFARWALKRVAKTEGNNEVRMIVLDSVNDLINGEGE